MIHLQYMKNLLFFIIFVFIMNLLFVKRRYFMMIKMTSIKWDINGYCHENTRILRRTKVGGTYEK